MNEMIISRIKYVFNVPLVHERPGNRNTYQKSLFLEIYHAGISQIKHHAQDQQGRTESSSKLCIQPNKKPKSSETVGKYFFVGCYMAQVTRESKRAILASVFRKNRLETVSKIFQKVEDLGASLDERHHRRVQKRNKLDMRRKNFSRPDRPAKSHLFFRF